MRLSLLVATTLCIASGGLCAAAHGHNDQQSAPFFSARTIPLTVYP